MDTNTKNRNRKGELLIVLSTLIILVTISVGAVYPRSQQNVATRTTSAQAVTGTTSDSKTDIGTNKKVLPLSLAIQSYSETEAENVDLLATVIELIPEQQGIAPWGNTILVQDGSYKAGIHNINQADFQNLQPGDWVEIKGGYMQNPENNIVQIFNTESVTIRMSSADNPDNYSK